MPTVNPQVPGSSPGRGAKISRAAFLNAALFLCLKIEATLSSSYTYIFKIDAAKMGINFNLKNFLSSKKSPFFVSNRKYFKLLKF